MDDLKKLRDLSDQFPEVVVLGTDPVSDEWIGRAEARLSVKLPASFREFATRHGDGLIGGEEVYGLLGVDFEDACGPDVVYHTLLARRFHSNQHLVSVMDAGDERFLIDTSRKNDEGENPIVIWEIETPADYRDFAESFARFLVVRAEFAIAGFE